MQIIYLTKVFFHYLTILVRKNSDLPYLILEITDINDINYGTNNSINKASFY